MNANARWIALATVGPLVLGFAALRATAEGSNDKDAVRLTPIKHAALLAKIAADKGAKLTLVDAWATWCGPCKENFPHVLEMNEKYGKLGLSVISLSLDDPKKPKAIAEATDFLKGKNATTTNYLLDETADDGFEKLNIGAIPAVFVYGPGGKEIKRFTLDDVNNRFTYAEVEAFVKDRLEAGASKK